MKIIVEFDNITEPQAIALEDLFKTMEWCGNIGTSRWTSFFSDGDVHGLFSRVTYSKCYGFVLY